MLHGTHAAPPRLVLRLEPLSGAWLLRVDDTGSAFDPVAAATAPASGSLEEVRIGGLGLHLVHSYAKVMAYRRDDDWNRLSLWL